MTSQARRGGRWPVLTIGLVLAVFLPCLASALAWVGRPFAGFLTLENGVVVSIGRAEWMPGRHRRAQWSRVIAVDDRPVTGGADIHACVEARGAGKPIRYTFRLGSEMFRLALKVRTFRRDDFLVLLAPLLGVGLLMALAGAAILWRRPDAPAAHALFAVCLSFGLMLMTGPDEYYPYRFSPVFFLSVAIVPASILHFDLAYPQPSSLLGRKVPVYAALYLPFAALGFGLLASRAQPGLFLPLLYTVYLLTANAVLLGVGRVVLAMTRGARPVAPLLLVLAAVLGSSVPIAILVSYPLLQGSISPLLLVAPLLLIPALIGTAFLRFPAPAPSSIEALS